MVGLFHDHWAVWVRPRLLAICSHLLSQVAVPSIVLSACSDYNLTAVNDKAYAGDSAEEWVPATETWSSSDYYREPDTFENCFSLTQTQSYFAGDEWASGPGEYCVAQFARDDATPDALFRFYNAITEIFVWGYPDSHQPVYTLRVVGVDMDNQLNDINVYPIRGNFYSGYTSVGDVIPWDLRAADDPLWQIQVPLGDINGCLSQDECRWRDVIVEIRDYASSRLQDCEKYAPLTVCFNTPSDRAASDLRTARISAAATCAPGRGRFRMFPRWGADANHDARVTLGLLPFMESGEGVLTGDASITSVRLTAGSAGPVSLLTDGERPRLSAEDRLASHFGKNWPLDGVGASFPPGTAFGGDQFVLERADTNRELDVGVDMEWACDSSTPTEMVELPQGYSFALSELGCIVDIPQKFTIRTGGTSVKRTVSVEPYGVPSAKRSVPLSPSPIGEGLSLNWGDFSLDATILDQDADSMTLDIASALYGGIPVCSPGPYAIWSER